MKVLLLMSVVVNLLILGNSQNDTTDQFSFVSSVRAHNESGDDANTDQAAENIESKPADNTIIEIEELEENFKELRKNISNQLKIIVTRLKRNISKQLDKYEASTAEVTTTTTASSLDEFPTIPSSRNCDDLYQDGFRQDGIFRLFTGQNVFTAYCEFPNDGHGWLVFQRRFNGAVDFYRNWTSYEIGFGDKTGEHWLGLQFLHEITSLGSYRLRVDLEDWEGEQRYAEYSTFLIGDFETNYSLSVGGYSGNAEDSFSNHNNMPFTTKDRENHEPIQVFGNCAVRFHGAWWYHRCHNSNLNGRYRNSSFDQDGSALEWSFWKDYYSMKRTVMKIRPSSNF